MFKKKNSEQVRTSHVFEANQKVPFSKSTQGFCILDANLRVVTWDSNMVKVTGHSEKEVLGENLFRKTYSHLFPIERVFKEALLSKSALELDHYSADRNQWFRISLFPMEESLFATLSDITEEKNRYRELLEVKNLKRHILNSTSDYIWAIDHQYHLLSANKSYFQIMERNLGEHIQVGDNVLSMKGKEDKRGHRLQLWKEYYDLALNGQRTVSTISVADETESLLHEVTFEPIISERNHLHIIGVACFARDVSERARHMESIEKQNTQLREIAWLQSHKMRAPVSNILGLTDLVLSCDDQDEKLELIKLLQDAALQLDQIIMEVSKKTTRA